MLIRPSLEKFPSTGRHIEVVDFSRQHPAFLNRQIISILYEKSLGVKDEVFQGLQVRNSSLLDFLNSSSASHVIIFSQWNSPSNGWIVQDSMLETLEGLATNARMARHVLRDYASKHEYSKSFLPFL